MDKREQLTARELNALPAWWQIAFASRCLKISILQTGNIYNDGTESALASALTAINIAERFALEPPVFSLDALQASPEWLRAPNKLKKTLSHLEGLHREVINLSYRARNARHEAEVCEARAAAEPGDQAYIERATNVRQSADAFERATNEAKSARAIALPASEEMVRTWRRKQINDILFRLAMLSNHHNNPTYEDHLAEDSDSRDFPKETRTANASPCLPGDAIEPEDSDDFELLSWAVLSSNFDYKESVNRHTRWLVASTLHDSRLPNNWSELRNSLDWLTDKKITAIAVAAAAAEMLRAVCHLLNRLTISFVTDNRPRAFDLCVLSACRLAVLSQGHDIMAYDSFMALMRKELRYLVASAGDATECSPIPAVWLLGISDEVARIMARAATNTVQTPAVIDSSAWSLANEQRVSLVKKKYRGGGLLPDEESELARLQELADRYLGQSEPPSVLTDADRKFLTSILRK
ncbi:hypothetical protein R5W23_003387 [Gemmata sp. JC673]|uniref:Uncharacterized protein n=1 Tax=Gemmata algarum TaxID=2975278 RepID=A0ABU5F582_9BACT|nr:hypothetical protein [Gemmata algarum]MDY3561957.1 hypothetical protein [Gemmata algarum]